MPKGALVLAIVIGLNLVNPVCAQQLPAPQSLKVTLKNGVFYGSWEAIEGASYYEVWTKLYGNWHFSEKEHQLMPFTSSFELAGSDERSLFKVRAVSSDGTRGEFGQAVSATVETESARESRASRPSSADKTGEATFDPEAPPPSAPKGLFAVWIDPRSVRLIWQAVDAAARYSVEELRDDKWASVVGLEVIKSTTVVIKDRPMPGPYRFRIRAIGANGRASAPSWATTLKR